MLVDPLKAHQHYTVTPTINQAQSFKDQQSWRFAKLLPPLQQLLKGCSSCSCCCIPDQRANARTRGHSLVGQNRRMQPSPQKLHGSRSLHASGTEIHARVSAGLLAWSLQSPSAFVGGSGFWKRNQLPKMSASFSMRAR